MDAGPFANILHMMIVVFILGCFYLLGLIVLIAALLRAPEGFEDQEGFHAGRGPLADDPLR